MDSFAITEGMLPQSDSQDARAADSGGSGPIPEGANKFQRAIAAWRGTIPPKMSLRYLWKFLATDPPGS